MSPYHLHCTVCDENFNQRESWLSHLLTSTYHQVRARRDCLRWNKKEKECVVVVVCSTSIGSAEDDDDENLLRHLSETTSGTIVTDFIWWPERDKVGLVQFESREKIVEVLGGKHASVKELRLNDHRVVQMRRADSYLDFEWNEFILGGKTGDLKECSSRSSSSRSSLRKSTEPPGVVGSSDADPHNVSVSIVEQPPPRSPIVIDVDCDSDSEPELLKSRTVSPPAKKEVNVFLYYKHLASQFQEICKIVEIPDDEFNEALKIVDRVKQAFGEKSEVAMYRNWYLKLRSPGSDTLTINVYLIEDSGATTVLSQNKLFKLLRQEFSGFKISIFESGIMYMNSITRIRFNLSSSRVCIMESQMCLLVEYFRYFDPRVTPLLKLIFIWARVNNVNFQGPRVSKKLRPGPASLIWLVVLFLCNSGILPTPREIQDIPHQPVIVTINRRRRDVGFCPDSDFVQEWRNHKCPALWKKKQPVFLFMKVLTLAKNFFKFYSTILSSGEWVLNTKDGEILELEHVLNPEASPAGFTKLTQSEYNAATSSILESQKANNDGSRIFMMHPFDSSLQLSFHEKQYANKMKRTFRQLKSLIKDKCEGINSLERALFCGKKFVKFAKRKNCQTNYGFWKEHDVKSVKNKQAKVVVKKISETVKQNKRMRGAKKTVSRKRKRRLVKKG